MKGLVLSGGGVRGAYEVGVLLGLTEVIDSFADKSTAPLFDIIAGTSVGAINATYLASMAHVDGYDISGLRAVWEQMTLDTYVRPKAFGLFRRKSPPSLLDSSALISLIDSGIDWEQLHKNIADERLKSLIIAALELDSGRTVIFSELSPGATFRASKDPRRKQVETQLSLQHVLASAAIPFLFPVRPIGNHYFADGGIRFNTPISPAIRAGATELCVISARHPYYFEGSMEPLSRYPSAVEIGGKLLNALLLDPLSYDMQILQRFNRLFEALETHLDSSEMKRVQDIIQESRGAPYRSLKTLFFFPSKDISSMASAYLSESKNCKKFPTWLKAMVRFNRSRQQQSFADIASYLMFDQGFIQKLVDLGRQDVFSKKEEVVSFFSTATITE